MNRQAGADAIDWLLRKRQVRLNASFDGFGSLGPTRCAVASESWAPLMNWDAQRQNGVQAGFGELGIKYIGTGVPVAVSRECKEWRGRCTLDRCHRVA